MFDKIDLDEIGMKEKIKSEVERFKHFQRGVLGSTEKIEVKEVDIRNYAKYILRDGRDFEKRELLKNIKSRVVILNKRLICDSLEIKFSS